MKYLLSLIIMLLTFNSSAQDGSGVNYEQEIRTINENVKAVQERYDKEIIQLRSRVNILQSENITLRSNIDSLHANHSRTASAVSKLHSQTEVNTDAIEQTRDELGFKIVQTGESSDRRITDVDQSLVKSSIYGTIGVLAALLFSGLLYLVLSKRQITDKTDIIEQLSQTKSSIEESLVKEFGKQTEMIEAQVHLIEQQKQAQAATPVAEIDHSLALKVADEITLIERNISLMDSGTKGLKQLNRSIAKLKDNLAANGYEMPVLLGKPLNQGMKIIPVSTIPDENLGIGEEIITKIIKPQVNFNDKMIQAAQIEVSVGY